MHPRAGCTRIVEGSGERAACGAGERGRFVLVVVYLSGVGHCDGLAAHAAFGERHAVEHAACNIRVGGRVLVEVHGIRPRHREAERVSGVVGRAGRDALVFCKLVVPFIIDRLLGNGDRVGAGGFDRRSKHEVHGVPVRIVGSERGGGYRCAVGVEHVDRIEVVGECPAIVCDFDAFERLDRCAVGRRRGLGYEGVGGSLHCNLAVHLGVERSVFCLKGFFRNRKHVKAGCGNRFVEREGYLSGIFGADLDGRSETALELAENADRFALVVGHGLFKREADACEAFYRRFAVGRDGRRERSLIVYGIGERKGGVESCAFGYAFVVSLCIVKVIVDIAFGHGDGVSAVLGEFLGKREHCLAGILRAYGKRSGGNGFIGSVEHVDRRAVGKT